MPATQPKPYPPPVTADLDTGMSPLDRTLQVDSSAVGRFGLRVAIGDPSSQAAKFARRVDPDPRECPTSPPQLRLQATGHRRPRLQLPELKLVQDQCEIQARARNSPHRLRMTAIVDQPEWRPRKNYPTMAWHHEAITRNFRSGVVEISARGH